ncbi:membrane-flanked domain protein [Nitrosococcus halophilus Nc 4]|uniref:Membrane-flanked domain protein n=1 Tax=Nitrosococcus halophilus (strain Nc4) TaxID=472759 RepID=D5C305_NITHN|nr:PH domain-containing protein [Nitrosococcus halophilus]ADE14897.1 membrane-flanked domain protein [Nitrosococcus halophilus Nc 4]
MSTILYEANPSMLRMNPFITVLSILLIPVGIGIIILLWMYIKTKMDKLTIKEDEIIWVHGLLNKSYTEINMNSVRTVKVNQSLLQRMLNAGDVVIFTAGDNPEVSIQGLPEPDNIRNYIKGQNEQGG